MHRHAALVVAIVCTVAVVCTTIFTSIYNTHLKNKWCDTYVTAILQDRFTDDLSMVFKKGFFRENLRKFPILVLKNDSITEQRMTLNGNRVEFEIDKETHPSVTNQRGFFKSKQFRGLIL